MIDLIVRNYWEKRRDILNREKNDMYRPGCSENEVDELIRNRRGLLGSAEAAYRYAFEFIAAGLVEEGLEHARWAIRFGTLAGEVGDLGGDGDNRTQNLQRQLAHGRARLHASLYWGKWLLGDETAPEELERSLQNTKAYWEANRPAAPFTDPYEQTVCLWGSVVPFLRIGWVEDAAQWFHLAVGAKPCTLKQAARIAAYLGPKPAIQLASNAFVLRSHLQMLLGWLHEGRISEECARQASDAFHNDISRWGYSERSIRGRTWSQFLIDEHVALAQIRARYVTHETHPVVIVQSVRGEPM